jgi:hypothetical protein
MADNKRPWSPTQIIWSALIAVVAWSALGFSWFGRGFDWSTQGGARQLATSMVVENLAEICVAQARGVPDAETVLKQFAELPSWKQREFVEAARWAVMPGRESPEQGVSELCASKLRET